jgi:hypothetical protein
LAVAAAAAFYWLPASVEEERAAAAVRPAAEPTPAAPARPVLTPEESEKLKAQSGDLLAGLLTLQDQLTHLNVAAWAADDWAKYQQLSEAGDNAFLANDFSTSAASYAEAKALGESLIARAATTLAASLAAGDAALAAGDSEGALQQYDVVLTIEPTHAAALAGRARANDSEVAGARAARERGGGSGRAPGRARDLPRGARDRRRLAGRESGHR